MDCCCKILKYLVFLVNFIVTLAGIAVLVLACMGLVSVNKGVFGDTEQGDGRIFLWACVIMLVLGILLTFVGFLGCCGAARESQCLLGTYAVVMIIGLALDITAAVMLQQKHDDIQDEARRGVQKLFDNVSANTKAAVALQETLHCCGAKDFTDWNQPDLISQFPLDSCCKVPRSECRNPSWSSIIGAGLSNIGAGVIPGFNRTLFNDPQYYPGCLSVVKSTIDNVVETSPWALGISGLILVVAFIFSLCLCCAIRNNTYRTTYRQ